MGTVVKRTSRASRYIWRMICWSWCQCWIASWSQANCSADRATLRWRGALSEAPTGRPQSSPGQRPGSPAPNIPSPERATPSSRHPGLGPEFHRGRSPGERDLFRPFRADGLVGPRTPGRCPGLYSCAPLGLRRFQDEACPEWPHHGATHAGDGALARSII